MPRVCNVDRDALLSAVRKHGPATLGMLTDYVLGHHAKSKAIEVALYDMVKAGLVKHEDRRRGTQMRRLFSVTA